MIVLLAACGRPAELIVTSEVFERGAEIPIAHTCDGADASPPLSWFEVPEEAVTLAMIVEDADTAGPTAHWLWWDLDASVTGLPPAVPADEPSLVQGTTDMGPPGWRGPCPPEGDGPHHYRFTLYAVDGELGLAPEDDRAAVDDALAGRILGEGELVGTYESGARSARATRERGAR